jgi:hypothetical protein
VCRLGVEGSSSWSQPGRNETRGASPFFVRASSRCLNIAIDLDFIENFLSIFRVLGLESIRIVLFPTFEDTAEIRV